MSKISIENNILNVPNTVTIPYIAGDGIGSEIWEASENVFKHALQSSYNGERNVNWKKCLAGKESFDKTGEWMPEETLETIKDHLVAIKGPLETPVSGGIRSLNVMLRQTLDLYACVRPVKWFEGVPSPVCKPQDVDMVIFRENTEDIYAGIEWKTGSSECKKIIDFLQNEMNVKSIRFPESSSIGIKPISKEGSERIIRAAINYAIQNKKPSVTISHKGNIQKFTEGMFRDIGYELAEREFPKETFTYKTYNEVSKNESKEEAEKLLKKALNEGKVIIKDTIADAFFQNALLSAKDYSVVVTTNLNGDYISDALAAQVGGIGISPGANINYKTGHAIFEATHGTAPTIAGQKKANPCALLLSGVMLFEYLGWIEAAEAISKGISKAIQNKTVTADFNMPNAKIHDTFEFAEAIISQI